MRVLLADHLVDDLAQLAATLGGEGQPGAPAVARQLVGEVDIEGVHAGAGERQTDLLPLIAIGETFGDAGDLGVVGTGERQQADLSKPVAAKPAFDHFTDTRGMERSRTGQHARLAEAGEPRVHRGRSRRSSARGRPSASGDQRLLPDTATRPGP